MEAINSKPIKSEDVRNFTLFRNQPIVEDLRLHQLVHQVGHVISGRHHLRRGVVLIHRGHLGGHSVTERTAEEHTINDASVWIEHDVQKTRWSIERLLHEFVVM